MSVFDVLQGDVYRPSQLKESLAQYDNYQTYTLACVDREYTTNETLYYQSGYNGLYTQFDSVTQTASLVPFSPPRTGTDTPVIQQTNWLAIQTFSIVAIPVNFLDYVHLYHGQ
jgi:hypothetical protein